MKFPKKHLGRILSRWLARMSPNKRAWTVQRIGEALWNATDSSSRSQIYREFGSSLGITSVVSSGPLGAFEGSIKDDIILDWYMRHGNWEAWLQNLLSERIFARGAGSYLDIGANIGMTCIPVALIRGIPCHAFEPEPSNFQWLHPNAARNGVADRVVCHPLALSSDEGELEFEVSLSNMGDHRILLGSGAGHAPAAPSDDRRITRVPCKRLDTVLADAVLPSPLAAKLDVQGAEMRVFAGGSHVLGRADYLVAEVNPGMLSAVGDSAAQLLQALSDLGFAYGDIVVQAEGTWTPRLRPWSEFHASTLELIERSSSAGEFNVVLARDRVAVEQLQARPDERAR